MSSKGIILLDDYNDVPGATTAINEFIRDYPNFKLKKLSFANKPYFIIIP